MNSNEKNTQELFNEGINMIEEGARLQNINPNNKDIAQRYEIGFNKIIESSNNNYLEAHLYLGDYFNQEEDDKTFALEYYSRAATLGDPKGRYMVSIFLNKGLAGIKDLEKSFNIMSSLANENYHFAQLDLGLYYLRGEGCEKNLQKAFEFFNLAAKQGNPIAQNDLGLCYLNGEGTEKDYKQAFYWFNESGKNNNSAGYYNLGVMFINELGLKKDIESALDCIVLSARMNNEIAIQFCRNQNIILSKYKEDIKLDYSFVKF